MLTGLWKEEIKGSDGLVGVDGIYKTNGNETDGIHGIMAPITNVLPFDGLDKHHIMNTHRMMGTHHIDLTKKIEFPHIYSKMVELHQNVYKSN